MPTGLFALTLTSIITRAEILVSPFTSVPTKEKLIAIMRYVHAVMIVRIIVSEISNLPGAVTIAAVESITKALLDFHDGLD